MLAQCFTILFTSWLGFPTLAAAGETPGRNELLTIEQVGALMNGIPHCYLLLHLTT